MEKEILQHDEVFSVLELTINISITDSNMSRGVQFSDDQIAEFQVKCFFLFKVPRKILCFNIFRNVKYDGKKFLITKLILKSFFFR